MFGSGTVFKMSNGETRNWKDLIIWRSAHPLPLAQDRYRAWVTGRQIFVSSLMDQEMTPYRNAVRAHLHAIGASPVMWEEITPRDEGPQRAYLKRRGSIQRVPVDSGQPRIERRVDRTFLG
jgi:hypothetical protein